MTFLVVAHFDVSRWAVLISFWGLCTSHLVNLLSRWLLRHGTLIVHLKLTGYFFLNHCWYVVSLKRAIDVNVMSTLSKHWKYPRNLTSLTLLTHLSFIRTLKEVFIKLKQCKQTTGPKRVLQGRKCIAPRTEILRTMLLLHLVIVQWKWSNPWGFEWNAITELQQTTIIRNLCAQVFFYGTSDTLGSIYPSTSGTRPLNGNLPTPVPVLGCTTA